ncbi:MAG: heat-inducible transcription repressor HrcA [Clostridia bacterium]|nr:heat-inducible transcription repressor HrcA [Clostridia bacterium]
MDVDDRKLRILQAIVEDYILSNTPVGSRTLSKTCGLGVSSATIRNEMADLTDMGYLVQPHVSAGRVPSAKAYRLYVTQLRPRGMTEQELDSARRAFSSRVRDIESVGSQGAAAISDLTHYTALVLTPRQSDLKVRSLHLIPVGGGRALLVIVTDSGVIRDTSIRVSSRLDASALYTIGQMLTQRMQGLTLRQMREMLYGYAASGDADARVLGGIADLAAQVEKQTETDRITVGGSHNILYYPEYADVSAARAFMNALEDRDSLMGLLRPQEGGVTVRIGPETGIEAFRECSVITAPYRVGRGHTGAIAIVGPTRMPYARMMDMMGMFSQELTAALSIKD